MSDPLLSVNDLAISFHVEGKTVEAVKGISFEIQPGEIVGLVGESGSGNQLVRCPHSGWFPVLPGR